MAHGPAISWKNSGTEDPFHVVYTARTPGGGARKAKCFKLNIGPLVVGMIRSNVGPANLPSPPAQVHPTLARWLEYEDTDGPDRDDERELLLLFEEDVRIPRFPDPPFMAPQSSRWRVHAAAERLIQEIEAARDAEYVRLTNELDALNVEVVGRFWIIKALLVRCSASAIPPVLGLDGLLSVTPVSTGDPPSACGDKADGDDVQDARSDLRSDRYFKLDLNQGSIALLDTAVDRNHKVLKCSAVSSFLECDADKCSSTSTPVNPSSHGTAAAAILAANATCGAAYRGMTKVRTVSYSVYPDGIGLNVKAAARAIEHAYKYGRHRVIVAVIPEGLDEYASSTASWARNAFDAGSVVLAPVGNSIVPPPPESAASPARASKVLGIGAYNIGAGKLPNQAEGPTLGKRLKPDLVAPTNTETAAVTPPVWSISNHPGTSGAVPYAGGAAALARNWLIDTRNKATGACKKHPKGIDPGQVYAFMILSGQSTYPFHSDNGAGRIVLPTRGRAWWGKVKVAYGTKIDIRLPVFSKTPSNLDAALWWPEPGEKGNDSHNSVYLDLVAPGGAIGASSHSANSVFQRARVATPVRGNWHLRISTGTLWGYQTVYWAAHVRF